MNYELGSSGSPYYGPADNATAHIVRGLFDASGGVNHDTSFWAPPVNEFASNYTALPPGIGSWEFPDIADTLYGDYLSEDDAEDSQYEVLTLERDRELAYLIGYKLSEYVVAKGIKAVYFLDRSTRPAYAAMQEYWKHQYPDTEQPYIGFLNPRGFISQEDVDSGRVDLPGLRHDDYMKQGFIAPKSTIRSESDILDEIHSYVLPEDRDKPILVVDACIHSGETIAPLLDKLERAGLKNVHVGALSSADNYSGIDPDFTAVDDEICYPFGRDELTVKTYDSITSEVNPLLKQDMALDQARAVRNEVRRAVREYVAGDVLL